MAKVSGLSGRVKGAASWRAANATGDAGCAVGVAMRVPCKTSANVAQRVLLEIREQRIHLGFHAVERRAQRRIAFPASHRAVAAVDEGADVHDLRADGTNVTPERRIS